MEFLNSLNNPSYSNQLALQTENRQLTYKEFETTVNNCVELFLENGITERDCIVLCFQNQALQFISSVAALKLGCCHIAFQAGGSIDKKIHLAKQAACNKLICDFEIELQLPRLFINFETLNKNKQAASETEHSFQQNETAIIVHGSGTTGKAKLIAIPYSALNALIERDIEARPLLNTEKHFSFTPVEFYTAKRRNLAVIQQGACVVLRENFNANIQQLLKPNQVEHLSLASSHGMEFVQHQVDFGFMWPYLKTVFIGGSPISQKFRSALQHIFNNKVFIAYGTNEMGECCIASPEQQELFPNCVGKLLSGVEIKILNQDGLPCEADVIGELFLKADACFSGYLGNNNGKQEINDPKQAGWFQPRDKACMNQEQILFHKGRSDDAITFNGTMIYPREIEQVVENLEQIKEAAAFGIDAIDNQIPALVVSANKPLDMKAFDSFLKSQLGWLSPKIIKQVDKLPRNEGGKILKTELKKQLIQEINQQGKA